MDNMPSNLSLRLFDFCKDCDQFDTEDSTYYIGKITHHVITCTHRDACGKIISKLEGNENAK